MLNDRTRHRVPRAVAAYAAAMALLTCTGASAETPASDRAVLEAAGERYREAMSAELYGEAVDATKIYISELLKDPDFDRFEWSTALARLADAQLRDEQFEASIENYSLAIETIQNETDHLSALLIEPLTSLGTAYYELGDYGNAAGSFERAVHVQQVNEGLEALSMGVTLDALAETYYRLGDHAQARAYEQALVSLYMSNYPGDDLRQLPALYSQAQMFHRTGRDFDAQKRYLRIISLIERAEGSKSLHLLQAFYETADLMEVDTVIDGIQSERRARRFLRRAIHIAERNEHATPIQIADAYIKYGDFVTKNTLDRRLARRNYRKAWALLSSDESLVEARDARFGQPLLLNEYPRSTVPAMRRLLLLADQPDNPFDLRLLVRYDVDEIGEPRNITLVEGDPTGYWDEMIVRHVGKFVFRPAFVDGEPVRVPDQVYEIRYSSVNTAKSDH